MSVDLSSTYLGMRLSSPIVAAACPLTGNIDVLKRFEAAGAGAAVLPSLFEEQIEFEECMFGGLMDYGANSFGEATTYFPEVDSYNTGPDEYLETIEKARDAVSIPVIGRPLPPAGQQRRIGQHCKAVTQSARRNTGHQRLRTGLGVLGLESTDFRDRIGLAAHAACSCGAVWRCSRNSTALLA